MPTTLDKKPGKIMGKQTSHPMEKYLRTDRLPHIWCPGCGLGTTLNAFCHALADEGLDLDEFSVHIAKSGHIRSHNPQLRQSSGLVGSGGR